MAVPMAMSSASAARDPARDTTVASASRAVDGCRRVGGKSTLKRARTRSISVGWRSGRVGADTQTGYEPVPPVFRLQKDDSRASDSTKGRTLDTQIRPPEPEA